MCGYIEIGHIQSSDKHSYPIHMFFTSLGTVRQVALLMVSRIMLQEWSSASITENLHLPLPNVFIPTDFSLRDPEPKVLFILLAIRSFEGFLVEIVFSFIFTLY